jgi:hypothetical protein
MQLGIDPKLMDKYISEFVGKLIASQTELKNSKEVNQWWFNWLKLQPKKDFIYMPDDIRQRKGLNPNRIYIMSKVDGSDYAGLLSDKEKEQQGFDVNKVVTLNGNIL